jgi:hypothetical protein
LKLCTEGYQWYKTNKAAVGHILKVDPRGKYTVSEDSEHQLGKVDAIWVVSSSSNTLLDMPLKRLAKQRIKKRGEPEFASFDQYLQIRQSCWIIEERDGQYYCDCPIGMKVSELFLKFYYNILLRVNWISTALVCVTRRASLRSPPRSGLFLLARKGKEEDLRLSETA